MSTPPGPPPGYGQPQPPPPGYGAPPPAPPGAGPPYGGPPYGAPPAPPAQPPSRGGAGKIALVATAVVVLVGGFALFQLFGRNDPDPPPVVVDDGPTPTPTPTPDAPPPPDPTEPAVPIDPPLDDPPVNVESLVQDPVGQWSLVAAAELPEFISILGASSAVRLQYQDAAGLNIRHILAAFSSPEAADEGTRLLVADVVATDGELLEEFPVEIEGQQVGTAYVFARLGGFVVVYNNGPLMTSTAAGTVESIGDFLSNVPY